MIPYNFLNSDESADYVVTGYWGDRAAKEAERCGSVKRIFDGSGDRFRTVPDPLGLIPNSGSRYLHYCANETIQGVEFDYVPKSERPLVCDASSNILSKELEIGKHSLIYASAQKNIGPSGISVVIIKDDFLAEALPNRLSSLDYNVFAKNDSMPNTPNTWGIFIIRLVCDWLESQGGVDAMSRMNRQKADLIYGVIDEFSDFYIGHAKKDCRSRMNITFSLPNDSLESSFLDEAERKGFHGLKGHRSQGGFRASLYNAFPKEGVERLAEFMKDFRLKHS
jgi:phosphoserine aminotransferase